MNINQLPLWCRECGSTYDSFNGEGVCTKCDTPNVLERYNFSAIIPISAYSKAEARELMDEVIDHLIDTGYLPQDTVIL